MDPLCQSQSLPYLQQLAADGHKVALMTYEQPQFRLDAAEQSRTRALLQEQGIYWYPMRYHKRFSLAATAYDCFRGIITGRSIVRRHGIRLVHSRATVPAVVAVALARICGLRFLYDADSRLSEEYADNGHWPRDGIRFRLAAAFESLARRRADSIIVLSEQLRVDFQQRFGVNAPVEVIPCCVDTNEFIRTPQTRQDRRDSLKIAADQKLLIYVGKIGPRYLVAEAFRFYAEVCKRQPARLLILSGDSSEDFAAIAQEQGVSPKQFDVKCVSRAAVIEWLCAADAGLALIRTANCERGSSPIKIGEYLAMGLPVVVTEGIGDYSEAIRLHRLGTVSAARNADDLKQAVDELQELWHEGSSVSDRCRLFARGHLDLANTGGSRYRAVYDALLCEGS